MILDLTGLSLKVAHAKTAWLIPTTHASQLVILNKSLSTTKKEFMVINSLRDMSTKIWFALINIGAPASKISISS